jgi:penicillin amidase
MAWNLTDSWGFEVDNARLLEALGETMLAQYLPPFPYGEHPTILSEDDLPLTEESLGSTADLAAAVALTDARMAGNVRPGTPLYGLSYGVDTGIGSNNWVVSGERSETGMPLLANDPHLGIEMPSIWYEVGLHCLPKTEECPFDVVGFALPATPGIISGHNDAIAWGITNVGADVQDVYRITVNPENELQYLWNGDYRDMTTREEVIRYGDGGEMSITVRETHLGPIINDNRLDEDGNPAGFNNDDPLALRWTGLDPTALFNAIYNLNRAQNWDEFRAALSEFLVPAQNFVYADTAGNIGYQMPGSMPIRAADHSGIVPVDGSTDAYEWRGYIPFDALPRIFNPERGYIQSANQAVTSLDYYDQLAEVLGEDANYQFSTVWSYGYRGERIDALLQENTLHSINNFRTLIGDTRSGSALQLAQALLAVPLSEQAADWVNWFANWDGHFDTDEARPLFYATLSEFLVDGIFNDQLPEGMWGGHTQVYAAILLLDDPDSPWWDDASTPDVVETRDEMVNAIIERAIAEATARYGADRDAWRWGDVHQGTFVSNPMGMSGIGPIEDIFNRGPVPLAGGVEIVQAAGYSLYADEGQYPVRSFASMRTLIDLGDFDDSRAINPTGQSGHPFSPHYDDMIEPYAAVQDHAMWFSRQAVEEAAVNRLILRPAGA